MRLTFLGNIGDDALNGCARSAWTSFTPRAAKTFAVVVEDEGCESVVNETCDPPEPEKAIAGKPSFAASVAAPLGTHMLIPA